MFTSIATIYSVGLLHCFGLNHAFHNVEESTFINPQKTINCVNGSHSANGNSSEKFEIREPRNVTSDIMDRKGEAFSKSKRADPNDGRDLFQDDLKQNEMDWAEFEKKIRDEGFNMTNPEENPYAVFLNIPVKSVYGVCTGTLLTMQWVLTAAHCLLYGHGTITSTRKVEVCAGAISFPDCKRGYRTTQLQFSSTYYVHDTADIGILKTDGKFNPTKYVNYTTLLDGELEPRKRRFCKMTGFGRVEKNKKNTKDSKRKTHHLEVETPCPCKKGRGDENKVCSVPREDFGTCKGDSGGGLICGGHVVAVLKGSSRLMNDKCQHLNVTEANVDCGSKNSVSVFFLVYPYRSWIYKYIPEIRPPWRVTGTDSGATILLTSATWMTFTPIVHILYSTIL